MFLQKALKILRSDISRVIFAIAFLFIFLHTLNTFAIWQPPTANPPDNNVSPPINVGSAEQTKQGPFRLLETLTVMPTSGVAALFDGTVGIGTITPSEKLHVKDGNIRVEGSASSAPYVNLNDGTQDSYLRLDSGSLTLDGNTAGTNIRLFTNTADVVVPNNNLEVLGGNANVRTGSIGVGIPAPGLPQNKGGVTSGFVDAANYWVREANSGTGAWVTDLVQGGKCNTVDYTATGSVLCPSGKIVVGVMDTATGYLINSSPVPTTGTLICCPI